VVLTVIAISRVAVTTDVFRNVGLCQGLRRPRAGSRSSDSRLDAYRLDTDYYTRPPPRDWRGASASSGGGPCRAHLAQRSLTQKRSARSLRPAVTATGSPGESNPETYDLSPGLDGVPGGHR